MKLLRRASLFGLTLALPLAFVMCGKQPQVLPTGMQTLTGLVKPVEISLTRRGTHQLIVGGSPLYYLESSTVNLGKFEGREVELQGTVEANTDSSDMPVLVVSAVTGGPSVLNHTWEIPSLGITLETPGEWKGKISGDTAQFTGSGSNEPIFTVFLEGDDRLKVSVETGSTVTKSTLQIGRYTAERLLNTQTNSERIEIDLRPAVADSKKDVLTLLFTPTEEAGIDPSEWDAMKTDILHSLKFTFGSSSSSSHSFGLSQSGSIIHTGSGAGMPCGGTAGVLCPQGFRCEITDATSNTGLCQSF